MSTITLEDAQAHLAELIEKLAPGEEIIITRGRAPVAKLVAQHGAASHREAGLMKGRLSIVSDDTEHLQDFTEYQ